MLLPNPIEMIRVLRRMRGDSQSFLVQASDGGYYVAKFADNPQGNRTLINEVLASHFLSLLGVSTPEIAILRLSKLCEGQDKLYVSDWQKTIEPGLYFGSKCPVNPNEVTIFDFLPRTLYPRVTNLDDVGVVRAFDHWVAQSDTRQFIFAFQPSSQAKRSKERSGCFLRAWAVGNRKCFGTDWTLTPDIHFPDNPFFDPYSASDFTQAVDRGAKLIQSLAGSEFLAAYGQVPGCWLGPGDDIALQAMLGNLQQRQQNLLTSVQTHVRLSTFRRKYPLSDIAAPSTTIPVCV